MPPEMWVFVYLMLLVIIPLASLFALYFASLDANDQQAMKRAAIRRAAYYLPADGFTDGAEELASDRVDSPSLQALLQMSPGKVGQELGVAEKTSARKVIDLIMKALHTEFEPSQVYVGGSFKKNTALRGRSDIDLVMKLNNFSPPFLPDYYDRASRTLSQRFGQAIEVTSEQRRPFFVLSFVVSANLYFDLVFTCTPERLEVTPKMFRSAATSYVADEAIKNFGETHALFRPLALLCKHWTYGFDGGKRPKSYFVELFAMEAIRRMGIGTSASLPSAFRVFLSLVSGRCGRVEVKNLNPNAKPQPVTLDGFEDYHEFANTTLCEIGGSFGAQSGGLGAQSGPSMSCLPADMQSMEDVSCTFASSLVENEAHYATYSRPSDMEAYFLYQDRFGNSRSPEGDFDVWQGDHRYVCKGTYTVGPNRGRHCAIKWFKRGDVYEACFFQNDLLAVKMAASIVDKFNVLLKVRAPSWPYKIRVNSPGVWTSEGTGGGQKSLVEPFLNNFTKFNSNTGEFHDAFGLMQALSHFSYHITNQQCLLCDLQGQPPSEFGRTYTLTDPVICSSKQTFGPTDLGTKGIENFFYHHRCNRFCRDEWSKAKGYPHFTRSWGSLMA